MYDYCKTCRHDDGDIGFCDKCGFMPFHKRNGLPPTEYEKLTEPEVLTNADRLRAMTEEELAEWLDDICESAYDEGYTKETDEPLMSPYPSTASKWITWLKQEAPGDNH